MFSIGVPSLKIRWRYGSWPKKSGVTASVFLQKFS